MSIRAYQQTARRTENPREVEYRLFAQVTSALISAQESGKSDIKKLMDALDWNRRVWSALSMDCASPDNGLPAQIRANIISLSIFVSKHTSAIMREDEDIQDLIDINRLIMQGLSGE
ncbi:MAG: flagellar biosynthesis regulator FlhF [Ponticaulis sp.]|nr:flagellar biosynthesis regulator FlhF [Ponticaulis sp.]